MRRSGFGALLGALALALSLSLSLFGAVGSASAAAPIVIDPGYPGPTSTTAPPPSSASQDGGRVRAGETVVIESCGFRASGPEPEVAVDVRGERVAGVDALPDPPRTVAVSWNSTSSGSAVSDDAGCVRVTVRVHERDDTPSCPAANVNSIEQDGRRGRNELVVRGEGANGAPRTVTTTLAISCSNAGGAGGGGASAGGGSTAAAAADETAATGGPGVRATNIANEVSIGGRLASSSRMRWAAVNVLLLALAAGLLVVEWRRRARRAVLSTGGS